MKLYQKIARLLEQRQNLVGRNEDLRTEVEKKLVKLVEDECPSGSGFDRGTSIILNGCYIGHRNEKILLFTSFHHMDEHGFYTQWTDHTIAVRPGFDGIKVYVGGRDVNGIKSHIEETFYTNLNQEVE